MRVLVTGGAGFVGSAVVRRLRARGDQVVAAVRDPGRARMLVELGCELVRSDLSSVAELRTLARRCDAVVHSAGSYRVGIRRRERPAMEEANVGATTRVLDAAIAAGTPRIVYVSTVNVFGDTHGLVVDETYRRDPAAGFLSWYDETKYRAHLAAEDRIAAGAPIVVALPGQAYGAGDHSEVGRQLEGAFRGRLPFLVLASVGLCMIHVDDLAAGLLAVLDRGGPGKSYVVDGPPVRVADGLAIAARLGGHRLTALTMPTPILRLMAPVSGLLGGRLGMPSDLGEVIRAGDGVTYWASHARASAELGFAPRDLDAGLRATFSRSAAGGPSAHGGAVDRRDVARPSGPDQPGGGPA